MFLPISVMVSLVMAMSAVKGAWPGAVYDCSGSDDEAAHFLRLSLLV